MSEARRITGLTTIGYQGARLEAFIEALKDARVTLLLDVRELPISRRAGFSKTPLSEALASAGIAYRHEKALGTPRRIRYRHRENHDMERFFAEYRAYLVTQMSLLDSLARTLQGTVALMCFERDPAQCHRSVLGAELGARMGIPCRDLFVSSLMQ
ncbi:MAG TPA: DUF488 domain-containing protein [Steroidobacteraceae bacterium]|jgi:uncharacterized protein (DUF488 family)